MKKIDYEDRYKRLVKKIADMYNDAADVTNGKKEGNDLFHPDYYTGICNTCADLAHLLKQFDHEDEIEVKFIKD